MIRTSTVNDILESFSWAWLGTVIAGPILFAIVMALLNRAPASAQMVEGWFWLRYPPGYPIMFLGFALGLFSGSVFLVLSGYYWWAASCFSLALFFAWGHRDTKRSGWKLNAHEIVSVKGETEKKRLAWKSIQKVTFWGGVIFIKPMSGETIDVSHVASGLGCLAMHLDDFAPRQIEVDSQARNVLLEAYRDGLIEVGEDPDAWLAQLSGCLTGFR